MKSTIRARWWWVVSLVVAASALLGGTAAGQSPAEPWTGAWATDRGPMALTQTGTTVAGTYLPNAAGNGATRSASENKKGQITGTVRTLPPFGSSGTVSVLTGTWSQLPTRQGADAGFFQFRLNVDDPNPAFGINSFNGRFNIAGPALPDEAVPRGVDAPEGWNGGRTSDFAVKGSYLGVHSGGGAVLIKVQRQFDANDRLVIFIQDLVVPDMVSGTIRPRPLRYRGGPSGPDEFDGLTLVSPPCSLRDLTFTATFVANDEETEVKAVSPTDIRVPRIDDAALKHGRRGSVLVLKVTEAARFRGTLRRAASRSRRSVTRSLKAGRSRISLGRLAPGSYRLRFTLVDAAGNRGGPFTAKFVVPRRR